MRICMNSWKWNVELTGMLEASSCSCHTLSASTRWLGNSTAAYTMKAAARVASPIRVGRWASTSSSLQGE